MNFMLSEFVICTFWFLGLVTEGITPAAAKLLDCRATVAAQRERYPDPPCWGQVWGWHPCLVKTLVFRNPGNQEGHGPKTGWGTIEEKEKHYELVKALKLSSDIFMPYNWQSTNITEPN